MTTTAIDIAAAAYRQAKVDQALTSFSTTQSFPYNVALDIFNTVIREMNRKGHYWFCETSQGLTYAPATNSYNLTTLSIDPKKIIRIRKELSGYWGEMEQMNYRQFQQFFRTETVPTQQPFFYAKYDNILYFDAYPDKDYTIVVYYFEEIPLIVNTGDTPVVPVQHQDVLIEGIYAYLCERLGRDDYTAAYQSYMSKVESLVAVIKRDVGIPTQRPACF